MSSEVNGFDVSLEATASEAGVTAQAAYRYFEDVEAVTRVGFRCIALCEYERIVAHLSRREVPTESDLAGIVAELTMRACANLLRFPFHLRDMILDEYQRIGYDGSMLISELISTAFTATDSRRARDTIRISAALAAVFVVSSSLFRLPFTRIKSVAMEEMLSSLFVTVLHSDMIVP